MADAVSKTQATTDPSGGPKGPFGAISKLPGFVRETQREARKISWPTWKETRTTAMMVGIMAFIMSLFLFGVDQVFGLIVRTLIDLAK
jgi:preprotein translocase subunit SecE